MPHEPEEAEADEAVGAGRKAESRHATGREAALARYQEIIDLGAERDYRALADLRRDATTPQLLALLDDAARQRAEFFLRQVERWEESQRETALRRLAEARKALEGLDLQLARGLLSRVDSRLLDEEARAEKSQLLLDLTARSMELEALQAAAERLSEESRPARRPWWKRLRG